MPEIRPTAALTVKSDDTIGDVIRKMRDHGVGSVVVLGALFPHPVEGIFTERDILRQIDLIQHGHYWDKAIATVMTRKLIKINLLELNKAAEIMLKNNFRHLPVVYLDSKKVEYLAGVVSMRDLFKYYFELAQVPGGLKQATVKASKANFNVGVITKDDHTYNLFKAILTQHDKTATAKVELSALEAYLDEIRDLPTMDMMVLDLDWIPSSKWGRYIKKYMEKPNSPYLMVLYEPTMHEKVDVQYLTRFETSSRFAAFPKPIHVMELLRQIKLWS